MINAAPIPKRPKPGASRAPQEQAPKPFLNKLETAKLFDTTDRTISEWVRTRGMPHLKIGSLIRFHWPTVEQWALDQMQGDVPAKKEKSLSEGPTHPGHVSASNPSSQAGATTDDHQQ